MKKDILKFLVLAVLAVGAGPASSAVWQWSKTASSNSTADPTINWAEGMSPSSVNDSARASQARIAEWRDDISGALVSGGTSTAYTLTTNASAGGNGIASPALDGQMLAFRASATNGAAATLTVDGGTAYPLQTAAGTAVAAGTIISGTPYRVSFNLSSLAWVLEGGQGNPYSIPLGGLMPYTGTTAPNSNFILPAGQCISTATYATYWALMGSPAAGACPGGQFAVVDLRGRTLAALDNLNGSAASRMTNTATGCGTVFTAVGAVCGGESQTLTSAQMPSHLHSVFLNDPGHVHTYAAAALSSTGGGGFTIPGQGTGNTSNSTTGITVRDTSGGGGTANQTALTGGGGAHPNVQPTMAVTYLLRVI